MIRLQWDSAEAERMFQRLADAALDQRPLMQDLGEFLSETTKRRFDTSTAPDGSRWAPNSRTTYERFLDQYKGSFSKSGRISAGGAGRASGKKPLVGETRSLATTINYRAGSDFVEIGSPMIYAGVQQFGAKARSFTGGKAPWGDIPARPFLGLSDTDNAGIVEAIRGFLEDAAER